MLVPPKPASCLTLPHHSPISPFTDDKDIVIMDEDEFEDSMTNKKNLGEDMREEIRAGKGRENKTRKEKRMRREKTRRAEENKSKRRTHCPYTSLHL